MKKITSILTFIIVGLTVCTAQSYVLYGLTTNQGVHKYGTIFSYDLSSNACTALYSFDSASGIFPDGSLALDPNNNILYGFTSYGGVGNHGVIFGFDPLTDKDSVYVNLSGAAIGPQYGSLLLYNNLFYGMAPSGGKHGYGYIFSFDPVTGKDSIVYSFYMFGNGPAGVDLTPYNNLLYATTTYGGTGNDGTIFSFDPLTGYDSTYVLLNSTTGYNPFEGGFSIDPKNNIMYVLTNAGGKYTLGTILSFNPATGKDSVVYNFGAQFYDGQNPYGKLLYDTVNGMFYGMTLKGGANGDGVVFRFNPVTGQDTIVVEFNSFNGSEPYGNLILGPGNNLYGMTSNGNYGYGMLFSYNTVTQKDTVLFSFTNASGTAPHGSLLMVKKIVTGAQPVAPAINDAVIYPNPFKNVTTISFAKSGIHYIEIYDVSGKKLNSFTTFGRQYALSRKGLDAGIYFVKIYNVSHVYQRSLKVIVN